MTLCRPLFLICILSLTSCSSNDEGTSVEVDPWSKIALHPARDDNDAPNVFETSFSAREAKKQYPGSSLSAVWTYDGTVPGPLIDVARGDQLVVHFTNELPEATTIHWHGVRVPAAMDGTLAMQSPIEPGQRFDYAFPLEDAGLFWFHPHMRSDVQVEKGLYGVIRVNDPNEPEVDHESVLVLDDVRVLPDGTFPEYLDDESKMMGREGNVLLVNGTANPTLPVRAGSLQRLRFVNAANGRFFNLRFEGQLLRIIGTDGGFLPKPYDVSTLLIAPGERYDVAFIANGTPGSEAIIWNDPYERGHGSGMEEPMPLAHLRFTDQSPLEGRVLPSAFPEIERLPAGPVDHSLALNETLDPEGNLVFTINGGAFPDVPLITAPNGATRVFDLLNESEMDHPFHLHGFFFQTLALDGAPVPTDSLANKDTIIVRAESTLRIVSRLDEPGRWLYHCHILEHAEGGMAGELQVE